jgi:TRAP-type uncharacterized transport system substrate-binding protein
MIYSLFNKKPITEGFSQYSSINSSINSSKYNSTLSQTAAFDTNYYLRDPNKPIITNNQISLPVIRYGYYDNEGYEYLVGQYFRHRIYPIEMQQLPSNLETIYKFLNNDLDIAFINEELLTRFIKRDCKYLTKLIINSLGIKNYNLESEDALERLYPKVNFSVIGVGFYQDFYLIVNNFSNIVQLLDIKNKNIGILADSYYYFVKLASAYGLDITRNITIEIITDLETLLDNFKISKYDAIFIVTHPKNKQLLKLTLDMKVRFIHVQKQPNFDSRNNLENLTKAQQGTNPAELPPPPSVNRQAIYSQAVLDDLKTENVKETFNSIIKKYFQYIKARTVDLNKFHKNGNIYSYLETFSTRMLLVIRNDIPLDRAKYITRNYIDNLAKMRDYIDRQEFQIQINNFSSLEFNYEELISFDSVLPLAEGSRSIYQDEGLIHYIDENKCRV